MNFRTIILLIQLTISQIDAECRPTDKTCVFHFKVEHKLTMMHNRDLVFPHMGKLYRYDVTNTTGVVPIPMDEVITADGHTVPRLVSVVNGQFPGPDIVVYKGQTLVVNVHNLMRSQTLTIHWHGLHQRGTPWMDGVPYVTQCPISPGQSFRYEFKVEQSGTHWWHTHIGSQTSMGVFGALIVLNRPKSKFDDLIMQIIEWNHDFDSDTAHTSMLAGPLYNYTSRKIIGSPILVDGSSVSNLPMQSALINGRGRIYDGQTSRSNMAPLTTHTIRAGQTYRFRVISACFIHPFRISVDGHVLKVMASDGHGIEPATVESFIINPGERFDFELTADQHVGNYWIRATTLEINTHRADAILRYEGAPDKDPKTERDECSLDNKCKVLNCPFTFKQEEHIDCLNFEDIKATLKDDSISHVIEGKFKEFFLNFGYPGTTSWPGSINGRTFDHPDVNLLQQHLEWNSPCSEPDCGDGRNCKCSFVLNVDNGDTIQLVLTNLGRGKGPMHPIHMHGHSFHVLKIGYGEYNNVTGDSWTDNQDIDCRGEYTDPALSFCNNATWRNSSWLRGNIPDLELERAPKKDTITIPTGGYVVLRFRADNPGLWLLHCHMVIHELDGMSMMINESFKEMPRIPEGLQECYSFPPSNFRLKIQQEQDFEFPGRLESGDSLLIVLLVGAIVVQIILCLGFAYGRIKIPSYYSETLTISDRT